MINFKDIRELMKELPNIDWRIEQEEAKATKITTTLTGMPRGSGNYSRVEEGAIKIAELRNAYREYIEKLESMRKELEPYIDMLDDADERAAMRLRYIKGYSISQIADGIYVTTRSVYNYLKRAENKINRMLQNR